MAGPMRILKQVVSKRDQRITQVQERSLKSVLEGRMRKQSIDEKGQVLVFIILAIVAIFGFAALAVDFGRVFSERRRAQNAADAAAYAAAYAGAKSQDWKAAGIASSQINGYN